jgi:hypothetical protein
MVILHHELFRGHVENAAFETTEVLVLSKELAQT